MKTVILFFLLFFSITNSFGQSRLDIIDSLIFQARGTSRAIVLDNHQGNRHEYLFDSNGKLTADIQTWLHDARKNDLEKTLPNLIIDSVYFNGGSTIDIDYQYLLKKGRNSYETTLIETDTSFVTESIEVVKNGDSTTWSENPSLTRIQIKNIIVSENGVYKSFHNVHLRSDSPVTFSWEVYFEKNKVFFIDSHLLFIYVLYYKNGVPIRIEECSKPIKRFKLTPDDIIKYYRKLRIRETTEIKYGEDASCLENAVASVKTMEKFKKAHFWSYH